MKRYLIIVCMWLACGMLAAQTFDGDPIGGGGGGSGDVTGPASSVDNCVTTFDGTGGKTIQCNSAAVLNDSDELRGLATVETTTLESTGTLNIGSRTFLNADPGGTAGETQASLVVDPSTGGVAANEETFQVNDDAASPAAVFFVGEDGSGQHRVRMGGTSGNYLDLNSSHIQCGTDASCDIGQSANEVGTLWVQTIDDSDGTVDMPADTLRVGPGTGGFSIDLNGASSALTFKRNAITKFDIGGARNNSYQELEMQSADITCSVDGACDVGASAAEFGTLWVQTIDDSDGTVDVGAAIKLTDATYIGSTPSALPTCDGTTIGTQIFVQDTDAAGAEGSLCLCRKDGGAATYAWESLNGASC